MALLGTLVERLPLSPGILYLALGYAFGPAGFALMAPDPLVYSADLERMTEVALLISLFAVGLKLGIPLRDKRWYLPFRLAFPSMALTVALVAAAGAFLFGLSVGAAVLWARSAPPTRARLRRTVEIRRIAIACASASPEAVSSAAARRDARPGVSVFTTSAAVLALARDRWCGRCRQLAIGGARDARRKLVLYLRTRHQEAVGLDEFLLGLIAIAMVSHARFRLGFLAVFAQGSLQRSKEPSKRTSQRGGEARAGLGKRKTARDPRRSRRDVHDGSRQRL
jgi:hypothetical protein